MSSTGLVSSSSATNAGSCLYPREMTSSACHWLASSGSLMASASHLPPCGLKISTR
jgi:hypothetical protein